ncbi:hypothetical protein KPL47_02295 [Clostridium estertheticum]|uniref:hypothetical protein n=1 Tax=Clostridium estertheticum TaxID=238834 RepID=UPI001C0C4081|nr:hypothetical protein [Clostridium estertheticum]MBU3175194.1 hypothetical protein [Clostridium estertheticum]
MKTLNTSTGNHARKIVSIRQFNDILSVVGKGNKERKIFLTSAAKKSINNWLHIRNSMNVTSNALFITRNNDRITTSAV